MRAMILAAGFGTRMRPFTERTPKPLLPVGNRPQIVCVLELLRRAGVRDVVINLHHLPGRVMDVVGETYAGEVRIDYSIEPEILGTGGGLKKVESFFGGETFILANADALMDADLAGAARRHGELGAAATMLVRGWDPAGGYGRVEADGEGMIRRVLAPAAGEGLASVVFTGIHILSPAIFRYLPAGRPSCIVGDGYMAMLAAGERVASFRADGYWRDIGTIRAYFDANMDFLRGEMPSHCRAFAPADGGRPPPGRFPGVEFAPPVIVGAGCAIGAGSVIGPGVVLGDGCVVGNGCRLSAVVALPGARFSSGEEARRIVRSPAASVPV
jgi:NDP-sugar pyrophosphorylase family protein